MHETPHTEPTTNQTQGAATTSHPAPAKRSEQIVSTTVVHVDRAECDACGYDAHAEAFVFAEMKDGKTVSYCGSHGTRYFVELARQAVKLIDLRYMIESK